MRTTQVRFGMLMPLWNEIIWNVNMHTHHCVKHCNNFHFLSYLEFCDKNSVYSDRRLLIIKNRPDHREDIMMKELVWWLWVMRAVCNNKSSQSWENKKQNNQMTAERVIRHWSLKNSALPHTIRWKLDLICYGDQGLISHSALTLAIKTHLPCL